MPLRDVRTMIPASFDLGSFWWGSFAMGLLCLILRQAEDYLRARKERSNGKAPHGNS